MANILHLTGVPLRSTPAGEKDVLGGSAAENRGADFVKHLVPALRARTRCSTGHRTPINQTDVCLIGARRRSAPRLAHPLVCFTFFSLEGFWFVLA
jgi:hypothetical protein